MTDFPRIVDGCMSIYRFVVRCIHCNSDKGKVIKTNREGYPVWRCKQCKKSVVAKYFPIDPVAAQPPLSKIR